MAQNNLEIKLTEDVAKRFWTKVAKTDSDEDCWLWLGAKTKSGYGALKMRRKMLLAHRVAFALTNPLNPEKYVLHKCDIKLCCNPQHLYAGTLSDNSRDAYARGFVPTRILGERHSNAKLTRKKVDEIRWLHAEAGISQRKIARFYGVSHTVVWGVVNRKSWLE